MKKTVMGALRFRKLASEDLSFAVAAVKENDSVRVADPG